MASIFEIAGPRPGGTQFQRLESEDRDIWGRSALLNDAISSSTGTRPRPYYKSRGCCGCLTRPWDWWDGLTLKQQKAYKIVFIAAGVFMAFILLVVVPAAMASKPAFTSLHPVYPPSMPSPPIPVVSQDTLCTWDSIYLPTTISPEAYSITLHLEENTPGSLHVVGSVDITAQVSSISLCAVVHAGAGMTITKASYNYKDQTVSGKFLSRSEDGQQAILQFDTPFPETNGDALRQAIPVIIHLEFEYAVSDGVHGFFGTSYIDNGGATHYIYATQLESIYARELIPCFDEPQFKAKFQLTVVTPVWTYDTEVLSNMPNKQLPYPLNTGINSPIVHQFIESPPMPTYLLAIVIGELKKVSKTCGAPNSFYDASVSTDINVWSTPDKVGMLASALDIACSSMMTFAKTFDVPFPLPKLDIVGIPQFEDSMENWGLLIFRESMLLMDTSGDNAPTLGPDGDMEDMDMFQTFTITETIAHEVGHQWAGNLVTMNKWNELWLSEGLASYFQAIAADEYRPNYGFYDLIYVRQTSDALGMDSSVTTHALSSLSPVTQMSEFETMFDTISYDKGAAILRMLRSYLLYSQDSSAPGSELGAGNSPLEVRRKLKQFSPSTQYPPGLPWFFAFPPPSVQPAVVASPPPFRATRSPFVWDWPPTPPPTPPLRPPPLEFSFPSIMPPSPPFFDTPMEPLTVNWPPSPPPIAPPHPPPLEFSFPTIMPPSPPPSHAPRTPFVWDWPPTPPPTPPLRPPPQATFSFPTIMPPSPPPSPTPRTPFTWDWPPTPPPIPPPAPPPSTLPPLPPPLSEFPFAMDSPPTPPPSPPPAMSPQFPFTVRHPPSPPPVKAASTPTMSPPSPPSTPAFSTTTDPFLKGIGKFFDTFRFQSVDYNQLWSSISETTGQPVGKWMEAWTTEKNYPVLDPIVRNTPGVSVGPVLYVTQRSVTAFSSASGCFDTSSSGRWWIPMSYRSMSNASGAVQWHAFDSCSAQFPLLDDQLGQMVPASGVNMCVLVNPGRLGFYRTQYTSECWYYLTQSASSFEKISAVDLGGLLDDALHFSKTGDLPITPFLELTKQLRLRLQPEFTPWSISLSWLSDALFKIQLATISNIEYLACARNIETYIKASTGSFLHGYHVPGRFLSGVNFDVLPSENIQLRMLRPLLMRASGRSGDGVLTAAAWKKLVSAIPKLDTLTGLETSIPAHSINPDVREVVYALSVMSGDPAAWESIRQMYIMSNDPADAQRLLSALTFITDAKSIGEVMGFLMSSDVKLTDMARALFELGIQDGDSFYAVWTLFLGQRMDEIIEKYPSPQDAVYSLGGPLMEFGRYFVDDSLVGELQKFADNHANILNPNFMDSVKEGIAINSAWMKNNAGMLCSWMSRQ